MGCSRYAERIPFVLLHIMVGFLARCSMVRYEKLKKLKILLVDDNRDLADTVQLGFAAKGLSLTGVCSAREALDCTDRI